MQHVQKFFVCAYTRAKEKVLTVMRRNEKLKCYAKKHRVMRLGEVVAGSGPFNPAALCLTLLAAGGTIGLAVQPPHLHNRRIII